MRIFEENSQIRCSPTTGFFGWLDDRYVHESERACEMRVIIRWIPLERYNDPPYMNVYVRVEYELYGDIFSFELETIVRQRLRGLHAPAAFAMGMSHGSMLVNNFTLSALLPDVSITDQATATYTPPTVSTEDTTESVSEETYAEIRTDQNAAILVPILLSVLIYFCACGIVSGFIWLRLYKDKRTGYNTPQRSRASSISRHSRGANSNVYNIIRMDPPPLPKEPSPGVRNSQAYSELQLMSPYHAPPPPTYTYDDTHPASNYMYDNAPPPSRQTYDDAPSPLHNEFSHIDKTILVYIFFQCLFFYVLETSARSVQYSVIPSDGTVRQ